LPAAGKTCVDGPPEPVLGLPEEQAGRRAMTRKETGITGRPIRV